MQCAHRGDSVATALGSVTLVLEREAAIEGAVLVGSLPGIAGCMTGVESFDRVADFALTQGNQWIVPNEVRHAAAEIVRHRFDIDCCARRADVVGFAFVLESNRSASHRNYVTKRGCVSALESIEHRNFLIVTRG